MATAIRKSLRDFLAVALLLILAVGVTVYIVEKQRLRIPVFEEKPFELEAEFQTVQAVVPGQGQSIRVAGVKIGDVSDVEVENGVGVVTFAIDRQYLPIYKDATVLMRPTTALKDMFFELDPGTRAAGEYDEGDTIPAANTAPDVNLDEILAALDSDTQAYLKLLIVGAGKGLDGRDKDLGKLLGGLGPINKDLAKLNREVATRRENLANLIHNLNVLTTRVGESEDDLTQLVASSNGALGAIAEQDPNVQRAVALLPGTLSQARDTLTEAAKFAAVLGPSFDSLRPFARNLDEANAAVTRLSNDAAPVLQNEIRPFVRAARRPIDDLKSAATDYSAAAPRLTTIAKKINRLGNMAAYNPGGAQPACSSGALGADTCSRDEGYLYWAAWLGHNSANVFGQGDGNGFYRRIYLTMGCDQVINIVSFGTGTANPVAELVTGLTDLVRGTLCPGSP
jgi:phospholipid/cholesterol/gamma-HCH transport system substrate-binding protein